MPNSVFIASALPTLPWRAGWDISAPEAQENLDFQTLEQPGSFALPGGANGRLELRNGNLSTKPLALHLSCGLRITLPGGGSITFMAAGPGVLAGRLEEPFSVHLVDGDKDAGLSQGAQQASLSGRQAVLCTEGTAFALALGVQPAEKMLALARNALSFPVEEAFEKEVARRTAFWTTTPSPKLNTTFLSACVESLMGKARPPAPLLAHRWMQGEGELPAFELNTVFPLASAWCHIEPRMAEDLVLAALSTQQDSGLFPSVFFPSTGSIKGVAWPLMAQSVLRVWKATRSVSLLNFSLPLLEQYLLKTLDYYDPKGTGFPQWPTAEACMDPASHAPGVAPVDLISLLIRETEAFEELARQAPASQANATAFSEERALMCGNLLTHFWDPSALMFRDRSASGKAAGNDTPAQLLPCGCSSVPDLYKKPSEALAGGLLKGPPPALSALVLQSLAMVSAQGVRAKIQQGLLASFGTLSAPPNAPSAALAILLEKETAEAEEEKKGFSPLVRTLDKHRHVALSVIVGVILLVLSIVVIWTIARPSLSRSSYEALQALAHQQYVQGNYDEAARIYAQIAQSGTRFAGAEMGVANARFRQGRYPEAEALYRRLLEQKNPSPAARMNLALTLYRQNRLEESAAEYRLFDETYRKSHPQLAERARLALELLQAQPPSTP